MVKFRTLILILGVVVCTPFAYAAKVNCGPKLKKSADGTVSETDLRNSYDLFIDGNMRAAVRVLTPYRLEVLLNTVRKIESFRAMSTDLMLIVLNKALADHSAGWDERVKIFKEMRDLNKLEYWGGFDGPKVVDALLGFNSYAQARSEGEYRTDMGPRDLQRSWRGGTPWSKYENLVFELTELAGNRSGFRVTDAGAGIGRVGMALVALFPDSDFTGYEFVKSRVDAANAWAKRFGLQDRFKMVHQDLSARRFKLPPTELIYMYQPFTEETLEIVLSKIDDLALSTRGGIKVLTHSMDDLKMKKAKVEKLPLYPRNRRAFDMGQLFWVHQ